MDTKQFKFPFAESRDKLLVILKKEHKRIGDDVCNAILALAPYSGGDELLRGLHDLDIIDKHRLIVPVYFAQWRRHDMARRLSDRMRKENPDREIPNIVFISDMEHTPMPVGETIICEIGEDPLRYYEEIKSPILIRFPGEYGMPFQNSFVLEIMVQIFARVQQILVRFNNQFGTADSKTASSS